MNCYGPPVPVRYFIRIDCLSRSPGPGGRKEFYHTPVVKNFISDFFMLIHIKFKMLDLKLRVTDSEDPKTNGKTYEAMQPQKDMQGSGASVAVFRIGD